MKRKYHLLAIIALVVIALDQYTKHLILERFNYTESYEVIAGFFNLTYVRNTGAAFGLLNGWDPAYRIPFFISIPLIALVAILWVFRGLKANDYLLAIGLSLVVGGAIGNLIDRIRFNYVVDFFDFYWGHGGPHFAVFNVADSAISVGVGLLVLDMILKDFVKKKHVSDSH